MRTYVMKIILHIKMGFIISHLNFNERKMAGFYEKESRYVAQKSLHLIVIANSAKKGILLIFSGFYKLK